QNPSHIKSIIKTPFALSRREGPCRRVSSGGALIRALGFVRTLGGSVRKDPSRRFLRNLLWANGVFYNCSTNGVFRIIRNVPPPPTVNSLSSSECRPRL